VAATHGRYVPVIEIQIADHDAIGEDRAFLACLDAAAKDCRARCRAHFAGQLDGDLTWSGLVAANGAADRIDNGAFRRAHNVRRQILIAEPDDVVRQCLRDRGAAVCGSIRRPRPFRFILCHGWQSRRYSGRGACYQLLQELTPRITTPIGHLIAWGLVHRRSPSSELRAAPRCGSRFLPKRAFGFRPTVAERRRGPGVTPPRAAFADNVGIIPTA
jgi:hypothetical protein